MAPPHSKDILPEHPAIHQFPGNGTKNCTPSRTPKVAQAKKARIIFTAHKYAYLSTHVYILMAMAYTD
eukprot:827224-Amphidinium_carterae.1